MSIYTRKLEYQKEAMKHYKIEHKLRRACKLSSIYGKKQINPLHMAWYVQKNTNKYVNAYGGGWMF